MLYIDHFFYPDVVMREIPRPDFRSNLTKTTRVYIRVFDDFGPKIRPRNFPEFYIRIKEVINIQHRKHCEKVVKENLDRKSDLKITLMCIRYRPIYYYSGGNSEVGFWSKFYSDDLVTVIPMLDFDHFFHPDIEFRKIPGSDFWSNLTILDQKSDPGIFRIFTSG